MHDTMKTSTRPAFNRRAFVAVMVALTGAALPVSGWANHLLQFELTVQRHAWMAAHTSLGVLFAVFATWHVVLNRRPLLKHLKGFGARVPTASREVVYAIALVAITTAMAAGHAFLLR